MALLLAAAAARSDIYAFTDENGIQHFSNTPNDPRYRLLLVEPKSPAAPAAATHGGEPIQALINATAAKYQIEPALVQAVIQVESNFNPRAVSPKGAQGLMQLMPATAQRLGVVNAFDPGQNIEGGVRYLANLMAMFKNDLRLALAAYNAGENAVVQYGNQIPPYRETQAYVPKVLDYYRRFRAGSVHL